MRTTRITRRASLAALGAAGSLAIFPPRARAAAPVTLRVASAADDTVTPMLYALHNGLFANAGLDVVLQKANSGSAVAAAVAGGAMDIGRGSIVPLINAYARGVKFVLVAPATLHRDSDPDSGLLVATDAPYKSAKDLNGKVVSVAGLYDLTWISSKAWLDANGSDGSVKFIEIPSSAVLTALQDGRIAGGTVTEPYFSLDLHTGSARFLGNIVGAIGPVILESAWFSTADFIAKNADTIARFRTVIQAATVYTNAHHAETVDLLAAFTGMDPATIAQIKRAVSATAFDVKQIQPLIDTAARYKVIPQSFAASELLLS